MQSDCDFLIPVRRQVSAAQEAGLRAMHGNTEVVRWSLRERGVTLAGPDPHARDALDPEWSGLIQQVLDDRPLGWADGAPARPGSAARTLAFARYAQARASS